MKILSKAGLGELYDLVYSYLFLRNALTCFYRQILHLFLQMYRSRVKTTNNIQAKIYFSLNI